MGFVTTKHGEDESKSLVWMFSPHLSMNEDNRPQKPPRPALSIHMQHAQDLQETDAPAGNQKPHHVCYYPLIWRGKKDIQSSCKPLLHLMADVANTWPFEPTPRTMMEAMTTIKSVGGEKKTQNVTEINYVFIYEKTWQ